MNPAGRQPSDTAEQVALVSVSIGRLEAPLATEAGSDADRIAHSVQQHLDRVIQRTNDALVQKLMGSPNVMAILRKMVASGFSLTTQEGEYIVPKESDPNRIPVYTIAWKRYMVCNVLSEMGDREELVCEDGSLFSIENKRFLPINRLQEPILIFGKEYLRLNWIGEDWVRLVDMENGEPLVFDGKPVQMFRGEVEYEGVMYGSFYFWDVRFIDYTSPEWRMLDREWNPLPLFEWRWILDKVVHAADGTAFVNINVPNDSVFPDFRASRTGYVLRNGYKFCDKEGNPIGYMETETLPETLARSYGVTVTAPHRICICDKDGLNTGVHGYIDSHGNYDRTPNGDIIREYRTGYYGLEGRIWDYWYPLTQERGIKAPFNLLYKWRNWRNK